MGKKIVNGKSAQGHTWAIVLAAGEGKRLSSLTLDANGNVVPKQFCSLDSDVPLIKQTLARAEAVVSRDRITAVVSPAHVCYWKSALNDLSSENIIVQPLNRGTAVGILLPTLSILARDPDANVLILPSDHHVADESILEDAMSLAIDDVRHHLTGIALLGIEAHEPDPELGYIVPRISNHARLHHVHRFIEKPHIDEARQLCNEGALWNSFILAGRARSLVELCGQRYAEVVRSLQAIELRNYTQLLQVYCEFPEIDFSRHIVTGQEQRLAVMAVPRCGWNDLGTPHRLDRALACSQKVIPDQKNSTRKMLDGCVNLTERLIQQPRQYSLWHPDGDAVSG
jgi:mannose-1-phosphate guanylyltransferase